jgi:hypothetical protein
VAFRHISLCCNIYTSTFEAGANERSINHVPKSIFTWIGKSSDFFMSVIDDRYEPFEVVDLSPKAEALTHMQPRDVELPPKLTAFLV